MAEYPGYRWYWTKSEDRHGNMVFTENPRRRLSLWKMSGEQAHSGTQSMKIFGGGRFDVPYGCAAGSTTITVWVYPLAAGKCYLQVLEDGEVIESIANVGTGAWEQLSITFVATEQIYIVRFLNRGARINKVDESCWFDDLV